MQLYREFQTEASDGRETNRMGPWGIRMLEALQQHTAIALKENVPEQRIKRLMEGTLTALHGEYMSLILRNTSGTYDMAIECTHGAFPEYRPLVQDVPESNLMPRLWDMLYRGSGVIIQDVHQAIDNDKGQWDPQMFSKVENAILVPFLHKGEVQALLVVCNLTEEACDAYIRFVPLLKVITENMLREFPGDKGFTFLDAEPEKRVEDWKAGLYDTLFYHSNMGIFCKDNNHRYVAANDTFLASYHVTREEILGKTDEELDMHEYPEEVKEERRDELMELQQEISYDRGQDRIGQELLVMIEGKVADESAYIGRTYGDAPKVDGYIFVQTGELLMTGDFAKVRVTGALEYDLIGVLSDEYTE